MRSLDHQPDPSLVFGEAPWQWKRHTHMQYAEVVVQAVPDLRWTVDIQSRHH